MNSESVLSTDHDAPRTQMSEHGLMSQKKVYMYKVEDTLALSCFVCPQTDPSPFDLQQIEYMEKHFKKGHMIPLRDEAC